jgi:hypothetical protein
MPTLGVGDDDVVSAARARSSEGDETPVPRPGRSGVKVRVAESKPVSVQVVCAETQAHVEADVVLDRRERVGEQGARGSGRARRARGGYRQENGCEKQPAMQLNLVDAC